MKLICGKCKKRQEADYKSRWSEKLHQVFYWIKCKYCDHVTEEMNTYLQCEPLFEGDQDG